MLLSMLRGDRAWSRTVLASYPFASYLFGGEVLGASGTDGVFSRPARNADRLLSTFVTTYAYEFNDENAPPPQCGWKGGDSGGDSAGEKPCPKKNRDTDLTPTGLLMEGVYTQNPWRWVDKCKREFYES